MLRVGDVFAGKYQVERELGRGAFAVVYLAIDRELHREVAIKVLQEGRGDDRFVREAKLLAELQSPHTVTLLDFGRNPSGQLYMIFEYVPGETLGDRLERVGPMPAGRVVHIVRQILASLADAHSRGIVHRDIKPANIMMTDHRGDEDFVKLLDFGVAKPLGDMRDVSQELTVAGQLVGTMRYMAPEQLRGERSAIPASDVYAVGLVAYEMLTGEKAAGGEDGRTVVLRHLSPEPFRIPTSVDVPGTFRQAFEAMMVKDWQMRPRTALEALRLLDSLEDDEATVSRERPEALAGIHLQRDEVSVDRIEIDADALRENRSKPVFAIPPSGRFDTVKHMKPEEDEGSSAIQIFWFIGIVILSIGVVFALITWLT